MCSCTTRESALPQCMRSGQLSGRSDSPTGLYIRPGAHAATFPLLLVLHLVFALGAHFCADLCFFSFAMLSANLIFSSFFLASTAVALAPPHDPWHRRPHIPFVEDTDDSVSVFHFHTQEHISSYKEVYYFDQLIDHRDPSKGTFKQRYWHNYEFYEPGECDSMLHR